MKNNSRNNTENSSPSTAIYNDTVYDMLVFCDGSWDQTYRKTLCFLDRNAGARILYIEKPQYYNPEEDAAKFMMINDFLHVLRPNVASIDEVFKLLPHHVRVGSVAVGWFAATNYMHFDELIRFNKTINDCSTISAIVPATQHRAINERPSVNNRVYNKTRFQIAG